MSVRRLNRVPIVILTGVENAGKTTLAQGLATALHWDLMPEAARSDRKVRDGTVNGEHLQHMLEGFSQRLSKLLTHAQNGIVCDTGGLVLDIWARHAFGEELTGVKTVMQRADLHMLCHTLPDWEPDPLRTLPLHADRLALEASYRERLNQGGIAFCELAPMGQHERLEHAVHSIRQHCVL